jgi:hypothetical protein
MKNKFISGFVIALLSFFLASGVNAAMGVSPTSVEADYLRAGQSVEKEITISRSTADAAVSIEVKVSGDVKDWVTLPAGATVVMPAGQKNLSVKMMVKAPLTAPKGIYRGSVSMTAVPVSAAGGKETGVSVVLGIAAPITVTVVDKDVRLFNANSFEFVNIEANEPVVTTFRLNNLGNVAVTPKVVLDLYDLKSKKLLRTIPLVAVDSVAPFTSVKMTAKTNGVEKIEPGAYSADFKVLDGDKVVGNAKRVWSVYAVGSRKNIDFKEFSLSNSAVNLGESVTAIAKFDNVGAEAVDARLFIRVYTTGGKLIQSLESPVQKINPRQSGEINLAVTPSKSGSFVLKGAIVYGEMMTAEKSATLTVGMSNFTKSMFAVSGLILLVLLVFVVIKFVRK